MLLKQTFTFAFTHKAEPLLTQSAIGLPEPTSDLLKPARFRVFELPGLMQLVRPIYVDLYYRIVDDEYTRFRQACPSPPSGIVDRQVLRSIRRVAAFSAWEAVAWAIVQNGFSAAIAIGAAVALAMAWALISDRAQAPLTITIAGLAIVAARGISLNIPRKWPISAILFTMLAGLAAIAMHFVLPFSTAAWWRGAISGLGGLIALWIIFALALTVSSMFWIRAVGRRIRTFPEEEIIRSIAALFSQLYRWRKSWRSRSRRIYVMERLEWIARRFECEYVQRYTGHDRHTDQEFEHNGRTCARRFRAMKHHVVFPSDNSFAAIRDFLWQALHHTTANRWDALIVGEQPDAEPSRRERFAAASRKIGAIAAPLIVGALFFQFGPGGEEVRKNVVAMTVGWSLLAFIAMLDPKGFETQTKALESFGKLFTVEKRDRLP